MIKFNAKEILGTIAKQVAIAFAVQNGADNNTATIVGSAVEGVIKGVKIESCPKTIPQKLDNAILTGINNTFQVLNLDLPTEFENELAEKVFCIDMIEKYLTDDNPVQVLEQEIYFAFATSKIYDMKTLPIKNIAETWLRAINESVIECHELTSLAAFYETKKISNEIAELSKILSNSTTDFREVNQNADQAFDAIAPFLDAVNRPLFYESLIVNKIGGDEATLLDVFVEPPFQLVTERFELINNSVSIMQLVNNFHRGLIFNSVKVCDYFKKNVSPFDRKHRMMIIIGEGGMGKSSLMSMLAHRYEADDGASRLKNQHYFLKLKEIKPSSVGNRLQVSKGIRGLLSRSYKIISFKDSTLFLDGFDELCMLSDLHNTQSTNELLYDINNFCEENDCKCVITTRPTIIAYNNSFMDTVLSVKLSFLSASFLRKWVQKYKAKHPRISDDVTNKFLHDIKNKNTSNELVFGIPLTNYMGFCASILDETFDLSSATNVFHIYDKIFGENSVLFHREYDQNDNHPSIENKYQLRDLTKKIALEMFNKRRFFLQLSEVNEIIDKDYSGGNLNKAQRNWLSSNFAVGFYIGAYNGVAEFAHLTIQEYFAMDCFFSCIKEAYAKINALDIDSNVTDENIVGFYTYIYSLIAHNVITGRMLDFLLFRIEYLTASSEIIHIEKKYSLFRNSLKYFLLKEVALFSVEYKTNTNRIIKYLFFNLWNISLRLNKLNQDGAAIFTDDEMEAINTQSNFKELFSWMSREIKDFCALNLQGVNLKETLLTDLKIVSSNLKDSILEYTNITQLTMSKTNLSFASLQHSSLRGNEYYECIFSHCKFHHTILIQNKFTNVLFDNASMFMAKFLNCIFVSCSFRNVDLTYVKFNECTFENVDFRGADTRQLQFSVCRASKVKISKDSLPVFFNHYNADDDSIIVYADDENVALESEILKIMERERSINPPVLVKRNIEEDTHVYELSTVKDLQGLSFEYKLEQLTNGKLLRNFNNAIQDLLSGATSADISNKYDIEMTDAQHIADALKIILAVARNESLEELFEDFDKIMAAISKKLSKKN